MIVNGRDLSVYSLVDQLHVHVYIIDTFVNILVAYGTYLVVKYILINKIIAF